MNTKLTSQILLSCLLPSVFCHSTCAQGTGFSCQGRLNDLAGPANSTVVSTSAWNPKENIRPVDPPAFLAKVAALPLRRWNCRENSSGEHLGPKAQDFHAAFGVGLDDKHIATVDADGVVLAAIQGLNRNLVEELKRRDTENAELKQELAEIRTLPLKLAARKGNQP